MIFPRGNGLSRWLGICVLSPPRFARQCRSTRRRMCVNAERASLQSSKRAASLGVKQFDQVPRATSFPLLGSLSAYLGAAGHDNVQEACKAGLKLYRSHGPIVVQKLPGRYPLVHLFSAQDFQTVFQEEGRAPFRIGMAAIKHYRDRTTQMYTDASILHIQGDLWIRIRSTGQPHILRSNAVMSYIPAIDSAAGDAIDLIKKSTDDNEEVHDCFHLLRRWALESTARISLGINLGSLESPYMPAWDDSEVILEDTMVTMDSLQAFCNRFPYYRYFPTPMWRRFQLAMDDYTVRVTRHISNAASRFLNSKQREPRTILEHLLVDNKMDFADIVTFTRDLIMGGIETTASAATACLLDFAKYPEVQERARSEVIAVVGEDATTVKPEHLERLPYLNASMKETMRVTCQGIYSIAQSEFPNLRTLCGVRNAPAQYQVGALQGHLLSESWKCSRTWMTLCSNVAQPQTTVFLHTLEASRLPEHFSEPNNFVPERWMSQERKEGWIHNSFATLPFGSGRRVCLGRRIAEVELTILLAKILQRYKVEHHYQDVAFHERLFVIPKEPARLCFRNLRNCPHS